MKIRFLSLMGVLMIVGVLVFGLVGIAFANSVEWYMDSAPGAGTEENPYDMEHSLSGKSQSMSVNLNYVEGEIKNVLYWVSDTACQDNTTFNGEDSWNVILELNAQPDDGDIKVDIGDWDGSTFDSFGLTVDESSWDSDENQATYSILYLDDVPVSQGNYVAVKIENTSSTQDDDFTITDRSIVQYSGDEPSWPVPEVITIITISLAVLALGGFVWYRRRQTAEELVA